MKGIVCQVGADVGEMTNSAAGYSAAEEGSAAKGDGQDELAAFLFDILDLVGGHINK